VYILVRRGDDDLVCRGDDDEVNEVKSMKANWYENKNVGVS
jgi:hypothetical protein